MVAEAQKVILSIIKSSNKNEYEFINSNGELVIIKKESLIDMLKRGLNEGI